MRYAIIILDGAAGWPLAELGGKTTLAYARTPNLDALARGGMVGHARTVPEGVEPSSAAACTSILGYDPVANHVGRGAIEAASMGIHLADDEVALRMNLVHVADGRMISYACGHIPTEESRRIVADLASALADETFTFHPGVAYRHILVVKCHPELTDLAYTPPHDVTDRPIHGEEPRGKGADLLLDLMARAREVLAESETNRARRERGDLEATDIWPFWPGVRPKGIEPFRDTYGVRAAMTSGVDLLGGLAALLGIERLDIAGVTDGSDTDYAAQAEGALAALEDHDLVVVHIESPDEEGHAGDIEGKIEAIEAIDREVVARFRAVEGLRVLALPDHPTPIARKTHVAEPVPFVLHGPGIPASGVAAYDEEHARRGVSIDPGHRLMSMLLAP